ncbi:PQQ-dependent sugar dehydrogenase, partial [Rufibacter hautae]|uniref:PQQ-dependent sugar dehydrogenase n=1 Tax=Rufibacter hautae TaxID=2595005 RepID=UPI001CC1CBBC
MKTKSTFQLWKCILLQGFAFSLFLFPLVGSAQLPTSFQKVELITGLKNSINFEFAPDGRIFILDRYGELFIYKPNLQTTVSAGTLDVFHDMEEGLLAIAFDPNFTVNHYVYIHYSHATLPKNRVSRFLMNGDNLDLTSERVLLEWTSDRNGYFHAAGDMDFDSKGNLYIAIGDNSNHSQYAPLNESNANLSAERTSSNTNDFRGKILRIKPEANGTYTIPAGNLFPNGEGGLPEIYVMGARNPFKIFVDKGLTDWLFWGEVGPDADVASDAGPEGLDEINLTKSAGNYGWPYLSGANRPYLNTYAEPDFYYDKNNPVNLSKWNSGAKTLPPAQSSWLDFFHQCYLAGPRYYYNSALNNPKKLPSEFNQAFFYYDFNQSKIWVVKLDATGKILSNQPFAPSITGAGFMDLKIGPDGQLYILEYGAGCCPGNVGSGKLVRLDYTGIDTNKSPVVALNASTISGPLPLTVNFSSEGTSDQDGDALTYAWDFQSDGTVDSSEPNPSFTFTQKLNYDVQLRVTDTKGATTSKSIKIYAGNTAATFQFNSPVDGGMISWEDNLNYDIVVNDAEDGSTANGTISSSALKLVPAFGHLTHSHDGITINNTKGTFYLDPSGHDAQGPDDIFYIFKTSYTDKGGLTAFDQVTVHPKIMEAEYYDTESNTRLIDNTDQLGGASYSVRALSHGAYVMMAGRNLKNIHSVSYRIASTLGGTIEVHRDSPDGPILSKVVVPVTGSLDRWGDVTGTITDPGGKHDLYIVFKKQTGDINLFDVNYIEFIGAGVSVDTTPPNIYSIKGTSKNQFQVRFNEALDQASAESLSNYSVSNGISILSAVLQSDRKTVVFNTTSIVPQVENVFSVLYRKNESGVVSSTLLTKNFTLDEVFIRINSGGPAIEVNGVQWAKSQFQTGGTSVTKTTVPIDNTTSDVIYLSEVNNNFTYNIPVPQSGVYDVKLHFAELDYTKTGSRLFNVNIENGQYTLSNYDIFGRAGYRTAQIERFNGIQVTDGSLTMPFTGVVGRAKVNAIEVIYGKETVQKPNITITNPASGATVVQPFKINFNVNYWPIGSQTSHIHKIIDGVDKGDVISTAPITVDNLSLGAHTLKLALANADHSLTEYSHEIQINVASQLLCVDNPFPVKWTEHIIGPDVAYRAAYIYPVDINNDGFKDIVTGGWWYRNPGIPNGVWTQNIIGAPLNNMVLVHDLDKDGDLDIFGFQGKYLSSQMAWAQNDGKGNFIIHTNIPGGFPAGSIQDKTFIAGAAIGNFNGVENIQIALSWNGADANKLPVQMLTVPTNPAITTWAIKDIMPVGVGESMSAVDIDKDGDLDLFQGKNWLRNDNGSWTQFATGVTLPSKMERNGFYDLDRDGVLEAVVTEDGIDREISWLQIPTDPTKTWTRKVIGTDVDAGLSLDVVDFDFDGDLDVVTGEWKNDHRLIAFENDICDSGTWIKRILHAGGATTPDHHDGTQTVDLDNDGDLDVISIGWDKRTPRIFVNGGGGATNQAPVVSAPVPDQSVAAGAAYAYTVPSGTFTDPDGDALT